MSGDFRIKDPATFQQFYRLEHTAPDWARRRAYGLTEWNREAIREARLVACPGCFPTGALLALTPLARAGLLDGPGGNRLQDRLVGVGQGAGRGHPPPDARRRTSAPTACSTTATGPKSPRN